MLLYKIKFVITDLCFPYLRPGTGKECTNFGSSKRLKFLYYRRYGTRQLSQVTNVTLPHKEVYVSGYEPHPGYNLN